jgi:HlyD family secretion protein
VTNFEVKIQLDKGTVRLRPGLSCTAEIQTDMVKDAVSVPIQSVTIRTGDSNLSPEEIEQKKQLKEAKDKADNNAEVQNERLVKQAEKEERENLKKVVFLKDGNKAKMVEVTTGIADDADIEIKSGIKPGDEVISGSYSAISRKLKNGARVVMEKPEKGK